MLEIRANLLCWLCHPTREKRLIGAIRKEDCMWLGVAVLFLIAWLIAFVAFHVAVAAIHILLALFVIFLIVHFARRAASHA